MGNEVEKNEEVLFWSEESIYYSGLVEHLENIRQKIDKQIKEIL